MFKGSSMSKRHRSLNTHLDRLGCFVMLPLALPLAVLGLIAKAVGSLSPL